MDNSTVHFLTVFMAFFAIMNPIANASLFVGLTQDYSSKEQQQIAVRAVVVAFLIVSVFAVGGREIFAMFGITLPAFRIAGGLMIGAIGYHMLQGEQSSFHAPSDGDGGDTALDMAITPLGIPVLAGPGTIATAMNFSAESTVDEVVRVLTSFGLMCIVTFFAFIAGRWLAKTLGKNGIQVISRLMGLILAVVGVQMLIEGVRGAIAA